MTANASYLSSNNYQLSQLLQNSASFGCFEPEQIQWTGPVWHQGEWRMIGG
jgi:hypothetical protein